MRTDDNRFRIEYRYMGGEFRPYRTTRYATRELAQAALDLMPPETVDVPEGCEWRGRRLYEYQISEIS